LRVIGGIDNNEILDPSRYVKIIILEKSQISSSPQIYFV
jgi:hypothetical protein